MPRITVNDSVRIDLGRVALEGDLEMPANASGLVIFAHGSGSSRFSRRNRAVAQTLRRSGFGTLLLDLLTREEEVEDERTSEYRFDIPLLGKRVIGAADWTRERADLADPAARLSWRQHRRGRGADRRRCASGNHPCRDLTRRAAGSRRRGVGAG